jgi:hypothetical protein
LAGKSRAESDAGEHHQCELNDANNALAQGVSLDIRFGDGVHGAEPHLKALQQRAPGNIDTTPRDIDSDCDPERGIEKVRERGGIPKARDARSRRSYRETANDGSTVNSAGSALRHSPSHRSGSAKLLILRKIKAQCFLQ